MTRSVIQHAADYYKKGERQKAKSLLVDLIKQEPNNADAWYGLAFCVDEADRKEYCLRKVLEIRPEHEKAGQSLRILRTRVASISDKQSWELVWENNQTGQQTMERSTLVTEEPYVPDITSDVLSQPVSLQSRYDERPQQTKICPHCAETILINAKVCRYCGKNVESEILSGISFDGILKGSVFLVLIFYNFLLFTPVWPSDSVMTIIYAIALSKGWSFDSLQVSIMSFPFNFTLVMVLITLTLAIIYIFAKGMARLIMGVYWVLLGCLYSIPPLIMGSLITRPELQEQFWITGPKGLVIIGGIYILA